MKEYIGKNVEDLPTPSLFVDVDILQKNIEDMQKFCNQQGIRLRPHIKAHKLVEIGIRQLAAGAVGFTCAKVSEAEAMLAAGPSEIFIANEVVGDKIPALFNLAEKVKVIAAVDSLAGAEALSREGSKRNHRLPVRIEIDTGLKRCGLADQGEVLRLARAVEKMPGLQLDGIFTHAGHVYGVTEPQRVAEIGESEGALLVRVAETLRREGIAVHSISVGSTPTARISGKVPGVTEIRPGNYVFHDAIQMGLGVAKEQDCALRVVATVISRPAPDRAVIDAGSKTLALDRGAHGANLVSGHGWIIHQPSLSLERLSEEHGILRLPAESGLKVGARLTIIPNHACTAINLAEGVFAVQGGRVLDYWPVDARGRVW